MSWVGVAWAGAGYLCGTLPSTWIVARLARADRLVASARRSSGETDPHILMATQLGVGWTVAAATLDVVKGFGFVLVARQVAELDAAWLALAGVAVVVGHCFPFYLKNMAGRGLAAAAGVLLFLVPVEMTVAGILIVIGGVVRNTGLAATIGLASVPAVSLLQRQPTELVAMGAGIFGVVMVRRLEGVSDVIHTGVSPMRAVLYRAVFDSSGPPPGRGVWDAGDERPRSV